MDVILADTSIWINHLRVDDPAFRALLAAEEILVHPFVTGELAVGSLKNRASFIVKLREMPQGIVASDDEVLSLINRRRIFGFGIGYVDAHLLASLILMPGNVLWTRDRRLHAIADEMGLAFRQAHH